ncbi:MAG TPA: hypothetical protein VKP67_00895 [Xanthobacteraceae bacterium]|nr:hypothetical protein [Xanthobacteraceae bacterium]
MAGAADRLTIVRPIFLCEALDKFTKALGKDRAARRLKDFLRDGALLFEGESEDGSVTYTKLPEPFTWDDALLRADDNEIICEKQPQDPRGYVGWWPPPQPPRLVICAVKVWTPRASQTVQAGAILAGAGSLTAQAEFLPPQSNKEFIINKFKELTQATPDIGITRASEAILAALNEAAQKNERLTRMKNPRSVENALRRYDLWPPSS